MRVELHYSERKKMIPAFYIFRTDKQCYFAVYDFGDYLYKEECSADEVDFSKCREYTYDDYWNEIE